MKRTIFIGDVHGCSLELRMMIDRLAPAREDRVILLGDLINRGPDSLGVIRFVREMGFESLMGNHEYEFLEQPHETPLFHKLSQEIGPETLTWLQNRPLFIETEDFLAVHAGIFPGHHPALTPARVLLNIRTVNPDLGFQGPLSDPANKPWHAFYQGKPVFYGHWARQGLHIAPPAYGLDSGCVYGRQLSAWILETGELVQIQAKEHYYKKPYDSTVLDS